MFHFFSSSIVRRFNAVILSVTTLLLSSLAIIYGFYRYHTTHQELENKAHSIEKLASTSLASPLWNLNRVVIKDVVSAIMLDPDVVAVQVIGEYPDEPPLMVQKDESVMDLSFEDMAHRREDILYYEVPVYFDAKRIAGFVHIAISTQKADVLVQQTTFGIGVFTLILIILIGGIVGAVANRFVLLPILDIERSADEFAKGNLDEEIGTRRNDEIGHLIQSFATMRNGIRKTINKLAILKDTGEALSGMHQREEVCRTILEVMHSHIQANWGAVYLLEKDHRLCLMACYPERNIIEANPPDELDIDEGPLGQAVIEKQLIYRANTSQTSHMLGESVDKPIALLCIPMKDNREGYGVICFSGDPHNMQFHEEDSEFALTLARLAISRLKNLQMVKVIEQKNNDLAQRIEALIHDPLTGCWNQQKMQQDLKSEEHAALVYLKIDKFNEINAGLNFEAGNGVLVQFAQLLRDVLPSHTQLYRISGAEFGILIHDDQTDPIQLSEQLKECVNDARISYNDLRIVITISVGIARSHDNIFKHAHLALSEAKRRGKTVTYSEVLDVQSEHLNNLKQFKTVQEAFESNAFFPVYQGIRDNRKGLPTYGTIPKYECLMRLRTPEKDLTPYFFIKALERSGNISRATKVMVMKSFDHMSQHAYDFSVNLTEQDMVDETFLEFVEFQLEGNRIDPRRVTFEVLEGVSTSSHDRAGSMMESLKALGCSIAIDDFGAELSNIGRLLDFEPDYIKIDAKFIKNLATDKKSRIIVENIYDLAMRIGAEVVAEYVDNEATQAVIEEIGIHFSQGYLFSKPSTSTEPEDS